ncbi:glycosyltransferase family 2 protein [Phaeobacter inhibens]|uniref:Putative glycosyl transferase n=1 Tax=Phaeobacter inhibens TaxID=221822 RepID=A0A2I7K5T7_9RHOB|nr:glycosyltransferase family 2 protein [Phaeobacter inhibens]AUQ97933.1 putative glycosyl transferase [Phaeobacter inhibens]
MTKAAAPSAAQTLDTSSGGAEARILTIILNYKTPQMTLDCAAAALEQMEELPGEVVIIDNGSADGSYEQLLTAVQARGWLDSGRLRLIASDRNGGFGAGMNIGFRLGLADGSAPEFYYLLNSDAFVQPGAIRALRDFLQATPTAGLVGSYVRGTDGTPHCTAFRFPTIAGEFESSVRTGIVTRLLKDAVVPMEIPTEPTQLDWTAGASLMIRREVIDAVGGFDETFFLYFEETELCHRAARAGWSTHYLPTSEVAHVGSASTGMKDWQRTPQYWFDSRLHYFLSTHGRAYTVGATLALISGSLLYGLRRLVSDKPASDPPYFLRDLIVHHSRAIFRRRKTQPMETRQTPSQPEEQK